MSHYERLPRVGGGAHPDLVLPSFPCRQIDYSADPGREATEIKPAPLTHYVVVRRDLPRGFQAAQVVHAVGESLTEPHPPETFAVVLSVPGEPELRRLHAQLAGANVPCVLITEPDRNNEATAIGVRPTRDRDSLVPFFNPGQNPYAGVMLLR